MDFIFIAAPDPENSLARFYYYLSGEENVQIDIYNLKGKLETRITDGWLPPEVHPVLWSTDDLDNEIYLLRFSVRDDSFG
jgi:hypothetical protein